MSHIPERKEKNCLNCGTIVQGRYCQHCGQENIEPKETFWHMVTHFFYDLTHFDSNFFHTVHHLILKPGFLSREYVLGRRVRYLHPIRMYVFTSAIFFLLSFSLLKPQVFHSELNTPLSPQKRLEQIERIEGELKKEPAKPELLQQLALLRDTSHSVTLNDIARFSTDDIINVGNGNYRSIEKYDSIQKALPEAKKDNWIERRVIKKLIDINDRYRGNPEEALDKLVESILHNLPYMLFVSLPLFALLLKLVYIRRKQFYFADHGVFTIHLYVFTFLVLLAAFILGTLRDRMHWGFLNWILGALYILLFFYLYKGMRNFYGQRRGKTFLKFLLVAFLSLIMMLVLFVLFIFFSAFTL